MSKWKVPLPKDNPPKGRVAFAIAYKTHTGARVELTNADCSQKDFLGALKALREGALAPLIACRKDRR